VLLRLKIAFYLELKEFRKDLRRATAFTLIIGYILRGCDRENSSISAKKW